MLSCPTEGKELSAGHLQAFCTDSVRYGDSDDNGKSWYVMHGFRHDMHGTGDGAPDRESKTFGERLILTLDRRMPEPIPQLSRPRP